MSARIAATPRCPGRGVPGEIRLHRGDGRQPAPASILERDLERLAVEHVREANQRGLDSGDPQPPTPCGSSTRSASDAAMHDDPITPHRATARHDDLGLGVPERLPSPCHSPADRRAAAASSPAHSSAARRRCSDVGATPVSRYVFGSARTDDARIDERRDLLARRHHEPRHRDLGTRRSSPGRELGHHGDGLTLSARCSPQGSAAPKSRAATRTSGKHWGKRGG